MEDKVKNSKTYRLDEAQSRWLRRLNFFPPINQSPPWLARWLFLITDRLLGLRKQPIKNIENYTLETDDTQLALRGYFPQTNKEKSKPAAMLYFHGGGCVIGSIETHDAFCRYLANYTGTVIFSLDYRLAPEHKYPAPIIDAINAWNWLQEHAAVLGLDENNLGVGGDSAGGYLAFLVGHKACHTKLMVTSRRPPHFQYLLYPMLDLYSNYDSYQKRAKDGLLTAAMMSYFRHHYLNHPDEAKEYLASPLLNKELESIKSFILSVEFDPLADQAICLVEGLRKNAIECDHLHLEDATHSFISFARVSQGATQATEQIAAALKRLVKSDNQ